MSRYLKQHVKDWSKEESMNVEQYLYVRNGLKGNKLGTAVSPKELEVFGLSMRKGWFDKSAKLEFPIATIKKAAVLCMGLKGQSEVVKSRMRLAFWMGEYDEQYLYLISDPMGMSKIGISKSPLDRLKVLQTACGHDLKLEACWKVKDKVSCVEAELHRKFNYCRLKGEWFRAEEITPDFIESNLSCEYYRVEYF